jgi:superfamily II DNA helicase RecQ
MYAPTNAGKSLISQYFPLAVGGWVLVIIPLTRLGNEQVERVNRISGLRADLLHDQSNTKTNRSKLRQSLSIPVSEGGLSHR